MKRTSSTAAITERMAEVRDLCPEMRLGQMVATIGMLAEDETGRSLWDIDDADFASALERFAADLEQRATASARVDPVAIGDSHPESAS